MPYTTGISSFNAAHELTSLDDPESALVDAKRRVLADLSASRVWADLIGAEIRVTQDERPASLFRRIEFDYGEDARGEPTAYRDAGPDDPLSW